MKDAGYEAIGVGDGKRGIKEVKKRSPDLVLLDIKLPGMDGMKVLEEIRQIDKDLTVIMLTAYGEVKNSVRAMKLGAFDYLIKPFDNEEILLTIKKALQTRYLSKEVDRLRKKLGEKVAIEEVIGGSPAIKQVLKQVEIVAPTNMTVIVEGESGTGKEIIANMIHQKSQRSDKLFVAIDCGAIPETLVQSELFGYEKGAFTGADDRKEGAFEQANGGTLFLDEIANLSDAVQMNFLRVIEERDLRHLGGRRNIKIDVRIIVASNTDLSDGVAQGKFRRDLFHRLNEFSISLPPLRNRGEDIPVLAKYFLDEANQEFGKKIRGISSEAMKLLLDYHWPGNVRELRNIIRRALLLSEYSEINIAHLKELADAIKSQRKTRKRLGKGASFEEIIQDTQRDLISEALDEAGGNKVKTAEILQINRKALYRKMKSLGISS